MTRHGRNATNSAVYTYHERRKDAQASGYGTERMRLNKDAIKGFDCCSLSLQPCRQAVVTPLGWLYDKQSILEYMVQKKQEYADQLKAYEAESDKQFRKLQDKAKKEQGEKRRDFERAEKDICKAKAASSKDAAGPSRDGYKLYKASQTAGELPAFWLPSETPHAKKDADAGEAASSATPTTLQRPDKTIYCPMSGQPLRMKDLIEVKFTEVRSDDDVGDDGASGSGEPPRKKKSLIARSQRYKCAVTNDILRNTTPVAVLRPTGHVVTVDCVERIIKKDGMVHPLTGQTLRQKDIIYMQRGGTGYASANEQLEAKHYRPNLAIS